MGHGPVLIISGTNRPGAYAMKVARVLENEYRLLGAAAEVFSLGELPKEVFDPASYAAKPAEMVALQRRILDASGLHVVTPEYNGSFPGILKYFIDMLKFPESFNRKCVAFVGEAHGLWGALRSVEQLAQIFSYRNAHLYPDRVFIADVKAKFAEDGTLTDAAIAKRLAVQAAGFSKFIASLKATE